MAKRESVTGPVPKGSNRVFDLAEVAHAATVVMGTAGLVMAIVMSALGWRIGQTLTIFFLIAAFAGRQFAKRGRQQLGLLIPLLAGIVVCLIGAYSNPRLDSLAVSMLTAIVVLASMSMDRSIVVWTAGLAVVGAAGV